jgi:four helix bundle protein
MNKILKLDNLEIYKIARTLSKLAYEIYKTLDVDQKIIIGQQFLRSVDSVSANIAEGYGRFHFLDKVKFYYNARASLMESINWLELLYEREWITTQEFELFKIQAESLQIKLNAFIRYNLDKKYSNT